MTAFVVIWLTVQQLTVTLQSERLDADACKLKLAEMLETARTSGMEHKVLYARCEGGERRSRRSYRRRR